MHAEFVVNYFPSRNEVKQFSSIDATVVRLVAALSGWPPNGMMLAAVIVPAVCSPASSCSTAALQHASRSSRYILYETIDDNSSPTLLFKFIFSNKVDS